MKSVLYTALSLLFFCIAVSCRRSEQQTADAGDGAIRFGLADDSAVSRGMPIESSENIPNMVVYGYYTGNGASNNWAAKGNYAVPDFVDGLQVNNDGNGVWSYSGVVYWPAFADANVTFFAYSPVATADNGLAVVSTDGGKLVLDYTVPLFCSDAPDLMFAVPQTDLNKTNGPSVEMRLQHALTCIGIKAVGQGERIERITVRNVKVSGRVTAEAGSNNTLQMTWATADDSGEAHAQSNLNIELGESMQQVNTPEGYLMMIPQVLGPDAELEVELSDRLTPVVFSLAGIEWKAGERYNYTVGIPPAPSHPTYIELHGLYWATGNLVADGPNGCKIGAPQDCGLFFQFGSLVGYKGGAEAYGGTGEGALDEGARYWGRASSFGWDNDAMVWPTEMVGAPTRWPDEDGVGIAALNDYYFNYSAGTYGNNGVDLRSFNVPIAGDAGSGTLATGRYARFGVGDPCSYYLGEEWRLPTSTEYKTLFSGAINGAGLPGIWSWDWVETPYPGIGHIESLYFPASGYRDNATGAYSDAGGGGHLWSSTIQSPQYGHYMDFTADIVSTQNSSFRSYGFPVRCVQEVPTIPTPPTPDQYIKIEATGLYWATGNLVANGTRNCKVGAPEDYGLYFQFGSLIGYKGGAVGDGVGQCTPTGPYWGAAAFNFLEEVAVSPSAMVGYPTAWPILIDVMWFFGRNTAPYNTPDTDVREKFVGFSDGTFAPKGVGDPCTYYLGGTWRLPTHSDYDKLFKQGYSSGGFRTWKGSPGHYVGQNPLPEEADALQMLFFPASGNRSQSGTFANIGINGYHWTSVVNGSSSSNCLNIGYDGPVVPSTSVRKTACTVRCVKGL